MSNKHPLVQQIENSQLKQDVPSFGPGDTVVVQVKVREGDRERLQAFEGVVIAKRNRGLNSAFTVRKISSGVGVERAFQTHSPQIAKIEVNVVVMYAVPNFTTYVTVLVNQHVSVKNCQCVKKKRKLKALTALFIICLNGLNFDCHGLINTKKAKTPNRFIWGFLLLALIYFCAVHPFGRS